MLDIFMTKMQRKYHKALKWSENAQNILLCPLPQTSDIAFNLSNRDLHHLARIAVIHHHCHQPKGSKVFATYVREQGKNLSDLLRQAVIDNEHSEIFKLKAEFEKKHPTKLTPYGKFIKRRQKSIWKDFPNMHEVLVQEIKELDTMVREHILNIRRGQVFSEDLIGNDGSVSYGTLWVIDSGLWSVFNHHKVDPLPLATSKSNWFAYTSRCYPVGHWWVGNWNPDFHSVEEWELEEDEKYLIIT